MIDPELTAVFEGFAPSPRRGRLLPQEQVAPQVTPDRVSQAVEDTGFLAGVERLEEGLAPAFTRPPPGHFAPHEDEAAARVMSTNHVAPVDIDTDSVHDAGDDGNGQPFEPDTWRAVRMVVFAGTLIVLMLAGAAGATLVFHDRYAQIVTRWESR